MREDVPRVLRGRAPAGSRHRAGLLRLRPGAAVHLTGRPHVRLQLPGWAGPSTALAWQSSWFRRHRTLVPSRPDQCHVHNPRRRPGGDGARRVTHRPDRSFTKAGCPSFVGLWSHCAVREQRPQSGFPRWDAAKSRGKGFGLWCPGGEPRGGTTHGGQTTQHPDSLGR
jgi:hypothetical protein